MNQIINKLFLLALLLLPVTLIAQDKERQIGDTTYYKSLIPEAKQGLLKNMSMIANMQFALRNEFVDEEYTQTRFRHEQFRLEFRGKVSDKIYFRFRDRYTRAQTSESLDAISRTTDLAYIRIDATDKFNFSAGKLCADWGGFEFDYNPIDIYEYSDIIEYADNFLSGVGASYQVHKNHNLTVQILDSRTKTFDDLYGPQPYHEQSKAPLAFVLNWRGNLLDGKLKTIWSYSLFNEATTKSSAPASIPDANMNYIALGNELTLGKFVIAYDFKYSDEGLDRTHIISDIVPDNVYPYSVSNTLYIGHWVHIHYRVSDKINLALFGMWDIANWRNSNNDPLNTKGEEHIRDAYGYIPTFEYYPWKDYNMRFFVNWVGRSYVYSDYAKSRLGAFDYTTGRFCIGFVSPLGIF
jgi:hypothetical protein